MLIIENNIPAVHGQTRSKWDFLAHWALMKAVYGEVHPCGRLVQKEDYGRINPAVLRDVLRPALSFPELYDLRSGKVGDVVLRRIE